MCQVNFAEVWKHEHFLVSIEDLFIRRVSSIISYIRQITSLEKGKRSMKTVSQMRPPLEVPRPPPAGTFVVLRPIASVPATRADPLPLPRALLDAVPLTALPGVLPLATLLLSVAFDGGLTTNDASVVRKVASC